MSGRLYFTIGLPRSGKSTACDRFLRTECGLVGETFRPAVIIGGDDFRAALYGRHFQVQAEGTVFAMMDVAARALLSRGFDVIIDETSTTDATIRRYLNIDINARPVWVDTPVEVCRQRAIDSGKAYLLPVIEQLDRQLQTLKKGWSQTFSRLRQEVERRSQANSSV